MRGTKFLEPDILHAYTNKKKFDNHKTNLKEIYGKRVNPFKMNPGDFSIMEASNTI